MLTVVSSWVVQIDTVHRVIYITLLQKALDIVAAILIIRYKVNTHFLSSPLYPFVFNVFCE